jgi:hypothetical protein
VKPVARPAASGRPFNAHIVDLAPSAGLQAPVIYGDVDSKKYILEATVVAAPLLITTTTVVDIFLPRARA